MPGRRPGMADHAPNQDRWWGRARRAEPALRDFRAPLRYRTPGMFQVVLHQPEIPPNTGNIIRLCANTGAELHLVHPLGFSMDDTRLRRAGLDYHEYASVGEHSDFEAYLEAARPARLFAMSGGGRKRYSEVAYREGDGLVVRSGERRAERAHPVPRGGHRDPPDPDAAGSQEPQPLQCGRDRPVRGLASVGVRRRGLTGGSARRLSRPGLARPPLRLRRSC